MFYATDIANFQRYHSLSLEDAFDGDTVTRNESQQPITSGRVKTGEGRATVPMQLNSVIAKRISSFISNSKRRLENAIFPFKVSYQLHINGTTTPDWEIVLYWAPADFDSDGAESSVS